MVKSSIKIRNRKWLENLTRMNKGNSSKFYNFTKLSYIDLFQNSANNSILRAILAVVSEFEQKKSGSCYYT